MTHKVGAKGQVVIPKEIRERIGIAPGDEVVFEADDVEVRIHRLVDDPGQRRRRIETLRGAWADVPGLSTADLVAERGREREREERKAQRLLDDRP